MTDRLNKTIVCVGMMGAGKTAVGRALAHELNVPFVDSDAEIVAAANLEISEIFERYGEPFFRDRETQVIKRLLEGQPCVLSTGGGAFLRQENRDAIEQGGVSLWLDADLDVLWSRVKNKDTRPLLKTADPFETLKSIYDERCPIYELAMVHVKSEKDATIEATMEKALKHLQDAGHITEKAT